MRIVALDPSLTCTGVVDSFGPHEPWKIVPPKGLRGQARNYQILKMVIEATLDADLVVIEGYAFGAKGRAVFDIAELGGILRMDFYTRNLPVVEIAPGKLKKLATGKGNAPKEAMLQAAWQRLGYTGHDHNEADALWLLQAALLHYQMDGSVTLPKAQQATIEQIEWPDIEELSSRSRKEVA